MKNKYLKPEIELLNLKSSDKISDDGGADDDLENGTTGAASSGNEWTKYY